MQHYLPTNNMRALEYPHMPSGSDGAIANNDVGFFSCFIIIKTRDSNMCASF